MSTVEALNPTFVSVAEMIGREVRDQYEIAQADARRKDIQKSGHSAESTWEQLLTEWLPAHRVVTRKYIVGPGGASNEVDLVVLEPDYPSRLVGKHEVLVSGVAAAFSCKLTLKKAHIKEALEQKDRLLAAAGYDDELSIGGRIGPRDALQALRGPFPYGVLAHSSSIAPKAENFRSAFLERYEEFAYDKIVPLVRTPRNELDAILVADSAFFSAVRISTLPNEDGTMGGPASGVSQHHNASGLSSAPLVQLLLWLSSSFAGDGAYAIESLMEMLVPPSAFGSVRRWPEETYPDHIRSDVANLIRSDGSPLFFS